MSRLNFWVNGKQVEIDVDPGEMLSDTIRYRLGLTGTKIGCQEAECGTCTVLLDGEPVLSCNLPVLKTAGRHVTTIEGLAPKGELHPLQDAFIKHGAVQCGFCIPGQIMTAAALLERCPIQARPKSEMPSKKPCVVVGAIPPSYALHRPQLRT